MNAPEIIFAAALDRAYRRTREQFDAWAIDPEYNQYVVPVSTKPRAGFAILYTPPASQPKLLIVGQNPSNFAGTGSIGDAPNADMLSGTVPTANSYDVHDHLFGKTLRAAFADRPALYEGCVGMNVWHFQCVKNAGSAPKPLLTFCETTTRNLVDAMQPQNVLCLGRYSFAALAPNSARRVDGTRTAEVARTGGGAFWYVAHPTGSYSSAAAEHDLPVVLSAMARLEAEKRVGVRSPRSV